MIRELKRGVSLIVVLASLSGTVVCGQEIGLGSGVDLRVLQAGLLRLDTGSEEYEWSLGGVWTPSIETSRKAGDYRGEDARQTVEQVLGTHRVRVVERWEGSEGIQVQLLVASSGKMAGAKSLDGTLGPEDDLAVLLAYNGLAMCDRTSAVDREQADAICAAERSARQARRGIHDGGFGSSITSRWKVVDLGEHIELPPRVGYSVETFNFFFIDEMGIPSEVSVEQYTTPLGVEHTNYYIYRDQ